MPYIGNPAVVGDSTNTFKLLDDIQSFTLTFDATDSSIVSISSDTLTFNNHRFLTGQRVTYNDGGGTAIGGLADGVYFIIKVDQNTIKLASSASNAASSTAINLTSGAAGGSHTLNVAFDSINTKFSATHSSGTKAAVSRAGQISLSINGVIQQPQDTGSPTVGYGVLPGSIIIFSTAPAATDKVFGTFIGEVAASFDLTDNTVDNFTGDGSTTSFNLSRDVPSSNDVLVTLDGVTQYPTDSSATRSYAVIESTLTFVSAPDTGVAIQVRHIGFAGATTSAVTGFYGRQGNVALINTDDISVQNISAGIGTFNTIAVGGTVSIGGTLTYEDVTNIDSVGLVTARNGIVVGSGITLSKDGDGFFTGIVTATSFYGDGSNLSNITSTTINSNADNRLITGSGTANTLNGESNLTFDGSTFTVNGDATFTTTNGNNILFDKSDNALEFGDSVKAQFGASNDLNIEHDGSNSYISDSGTGDLVISGSVVSLKSSNTAEDMIKATENGAVNLYYDNELVFQTTATGIRVDNTNGNGEIRVRGSEGNGAQIYMDADDADDNEDQWRLDVSASDGSFGIQNYGDGSWEKSIECNHGGAVEIYHDNDLKMQTQSDGMRIEDGGRLYFQNGSENASSAIYNGSGSGTSDLQFRTNGTHRATLNYSGHFEPAANNTYDLGTSSYRWRNLYTNDLNLSNEGSTNSVDNTWGDYTIQEGESDLFLINNRSGKKYKFNLTEVS